MSETTAEPEKVSSITPPTPPEPTTIDLPGGKALQIDDANGILASRPSRLVVIAGPVNCGKTTLLTSIYESFQWGAFAGYRFFGSDTLVAFERRCFWARLDSGREDPDTSRTPMGDPLFLHLRLIEATEPHQEMDLLISDLSGEAFENARDSSEECKRLGFMRRADHVVLIIDGKKLCHSRARHTVAQDSFSILQSLLDNEVMPDGAHVEILISKWDFIERSPKKAEREKDVEKIEAQFRARFQSRLGSITFRKIAARPRGGDLTFAHGIGDLLKEWISSSPWTRQADLQLKESGKRESELFQGLLTSRIARTQ